MSGETVERRDTPTRTFVLDLVCAASVSPIAVVLGTVFATMMFPFAPLALMEWPGSIVIPLIIMSCALTVLTIASIFARLRRWSMLKFILMCSVTPCCIFLFLSISLYIYYQPNNYIVERRAPFVENMMLISWSDVYMCSIFVVLIFLSAILCSLLFYIFRDIEASIRPEQVSIGVDGDGPTGAVE